MTNRRNRREHKEDPNLEGTNDMSLANNDNRTIRKQVREFFRTHSENCYDPKTVALRLKAKYNTVKNYCHEFWQDEYLERIQKGLYRWKGRLSQKQIERIMAEHIPLFHAIQYFSPYHLG